MWNPFFLDEDYVKKRVVVAMSGGVDSSVTAALLKEQGYEVIGLTMHHWDTCAKETADEECHSNTAVANAQKIAETLQIPFYSVNFETDFRRQIINRFCSDYLSGRTPNPCAVCNKKIKFGLLLEKALELGADFLATGHYVSLAEADGQLFIRKGADKNKDQSYFLFALNQQQLSHCLFPLGELNKSQVRQHAARLGLQVSEKSESQDLCFIPDGDYVSFLEHEQGFSALCGDIVHVSGKVLGQHQGTYRYTIGQRKGLGVGWKEPLYVIAIDASKQQVIVGEKEHLSCTEMTVEQCCWNIPEPVEAFTTTCRIRYRHTEVPVTVEPLDHARVKVIFATPQDGVTPGQAAVFYSDDLVTGGGWIQ
ncbi:tRNA 2-thiouridine(34) synthase MnmA [uncultured Desulfuromusa sp.]|uniref:tRNA 2-thiouridine(34) synthase MnmA n=1 Tax=uncultured Desulfuromusa sp. TaxID=219183 RepID=UPI0037495091